jgi:acetolactate synthase-1/2/3 large subunit
MPKMNGARYLAETLKGYGVTHVFYVPTILNEALMEMENIGIKRVVTHGEKAAAYMADGYARVSKRPGVCMAQSVGAANLAAGLQDAYLARSAVIAITGQRPFRMRYRHSYQELEHKTLYDAVTKFNANVETVEQLPFLLRQAFREATSGAPAPVHLDLQGNSGTEIAKAEADLDVIIEKEFDHYPSFRIEPDKTRVQEAANAIAEAQRPIIVAGGGVTISGAEKEVTELAEMLSIPVATSLGGKGTIPENHPLSVGIVGNYSRACANQAVAASDLVIFIGSHTGSQVTNDWRIPPTGTPVIQLDIDPAELGRNYPNKVSVLGDAKVSTRRLIEALSQMKLPKNSEWPSYTQGLVAKWRQDIAAQYNSDATPIRPERIAKELTEYLPPDAILVADTGHAGIWTGTMVDFKYPTQTYIRAAGSLGWAFSAGLGAKCAAPERPIIVFTGDGGFWYHLVELETALRNGINTVTIVNNNNALSSIKPGIDGIYKGNPGNPASIYGFLTVDFAKVAQAIGCFGVTVTKPGGIKSALDAAFAANKPAVVNVVGDINAKSAPPWG